MTFTLIKSNKQIIWGTRVRAFGNTWGPHRETQYGSLLTKSSHLLLNQYSVDEHNTEYDYWAAKDFFDATEEDAGAGAGNRETALAQIQGIIFTSNVCFFKK